MPRVQTDDPRIVRRSDAGAVVDDAASSVAPQLSDGVVLLRPIAMADVHSYVRHQDDVMADRFEWTGPASIDEVEAAVRRWVDFWRDGGPERNFVILDAASGQMIGDCELALRSDGLVNVMYVVFAEWRRRGIATRAVRLLVEHAGRAFPGRPFLFRIHPDNQPSLCVAMAVGAERQGVEHSGTGRLLERWVANPATSEASR